MDARLPLSPQVFAILSALLEERIGVHYAAADADLLAERVSPRALERNFESLLDYYYFLRYDPAADAELASLVEALVVNETYFFREAAALRTIADVFVPALLARGIEPRIWCAASSTGEEPLTLAMLLDERGLLKRVKIVASDISRRVLSHAREGRYVRRSLRALPEHVLGRWLEAEGEGVRVVPRIADAIEWQRVNLVSEQEVSALGRFEIVICRNVLIYFRDRTVERVAENLSRALQPEGLLLVGASESLLRFAIPFSCQEHGGVFFYRKQSA
ncbi:MAG: protein-glutamate O-methyltransferase CheR [Pseudomonadota bacterium]